MRQAYCNLLFLLFIIHSSFSIELSKWTVLIYLNPDYSDLASYALDDFEEMAKIGSNSNLNIIMQMGRSDYYDDNYYEHPNDTRYDALRFKIEKNMKPFPENAVEKLTESSMASKTAFYEFIKWGKEKYPAEKYFLIFWDHGNVWKLPLKKSLKDSILLNKFYNQYEHQLTKKNLKVEELYNSKIESTIKKRKYYSKLLKRQLKRIGKKSRSLNTKLPKNLQIDNPFLIEIDKYYDEYSKHFGFNNNISSTSREIRHFRKILKKTTISLDSLNLQKRKLTLIDSLLETNKTRIKKFSEFSKDIIRTNILNPIILDKKTESVLSLEDLKDLQNHKIDIIGFDACALGSLEVAFSVKTLSKYMIASQETIDGSGWNYHKIFKNFINNPDIDPEILSVKLIKNFESTENKTISSLDLGKTDKLIASLNEISNLLIQEIKKDNEPLSLIIKKVRTKCKAYSPGECEGFIDIFTFLDYLAKDTYLINNYPILIEKIHETKKVIQDELVLETYSLDEYSNSNIPTYGSNGISFYFPRKKVINKRYIVNNQRHLSIVKQSKWDDFLLLYKSKNHIPASCELD
ncbi:clostripain-related cysteine peptidase [uncultured Aquimarina sp.]|uniref:clostripain-related cysteine peptidase n=1 Tax=uncultured Aquimarina sp. TaxID=575652 RepID=UPI0026093EC1|nr:clostripain-related cysteine peptidase [uncultured Aquimarina sp.]